MSDEKPVLDLSLLNEIDRLVHEPARLLMMSVLYVVENADFTFIMNQTGMTWGNLSAHMSKLEEAGYLNVEKTFKSRRPYTLLSLTKEGRDAFRAYRKKMLQLMDDLPE